MKTTIPPTPENYFNKFSIKQVEIKPFDPESLNIANEYITLLQNLLRNFQVTIIHRGSTAMGISGKGDIEIGIYPDAQNWDSVIEVLKQHFGEPGNIEPDYVRFNDEKNGFEIEIILQKGENARIDRALTDYLKKHPDLLKEYEQLKLQYSYSKREYQIQKDKFLRRVIDSIPD